MKNQYRMQSRPLAFLALLLALGLLLPARLLAQSGLTLTLPTYNCATGAITFNVTGSDGTPITYQAPGIIRASVTSNTGTIEQGLRNDPKPITITATQSGKTASITFDFGAYCASLNTKSPDIDPLVDLYNATNGANWKNKTNWLVGNSPCNWYGITCGGDGRVTEVNFVQNNLNGTLSSSLGNLSRLEKLTVFDEPLVTGGIPASLGSLSQLKSLIIMYTKLTEPIPASLGNLAQLESTNLGFNQLGGSIPASLGNLTRLRALSLWSNRLTGSVPASLGNLTQIQQIILANNQLSGCFPAALASLCGKDINMSGNADLPGGGNFASFCSSRSGVCTSTGPLTVLLPTYDCATGIITFNTSGGDGTPITYQAPGIIRSSVTSNTGTIEQGLRNDPKPITITATQSGKTASITFDFNAYCTNPDYGPLIDLYNATNGPNWNNKNWLNGNPCTWNGVGCTNGRVTSLALVFNNLTGSLPASLGNLSQLQRLDLSNNQLSGSIPTTLGNLAQLQYLGLYYNQLSGTIPASLGNLSNLTYLGLFNNQLSGTIPASLGNLSKLQYFFISSNNLTGEIPSGIGNLSQLLSMYLNSNRLTGSLPVSMGNLSQLQTLYVSGNQLTGTIPSSFGNLSKAQTLFLDFNQFSGEIPATLGNLPQLVTLALNVNQLTGPIPASLGSLSKLQYLSLADNKLTGSIPASLGSLSQLTSLYLNNNQLTGCFPSALSALCGKSVFVYNNPGLPNGGDFAAFCNNRTGSCDNPLVLTAPTYNCATGAITFNTTGGDFTPITYFAAGIIRSSPTSNTGIVEAGLRGDPKVLVIQATQSGKTVSINFDFGSFCANASPDYGPLVDLYNATNGPNWFNKNNWLTGNSPCNWQGVSCNTAGRVTFVSLGYNNLTGTLPASLGNLSQVQSLYLYSNKLSGSIPTSLGNLSQVQNLDLSGNQLTGSVPASLANLSKIGYLYLSYNQLGGCLPSALSALCGKGVSLYGNTGLPNGGDFSAFCNNRTGSCDNPLVLTTPTYNCFTGAITFNTTGGDYTPITYSAPGVARSSPTSSTGVVDAALRADPKVLTITAMQSGKTVSFTFDFVAYCTTNTSLDYGPLVDLYNATKGDSWFYKNNWLSGNNPCNWSGVECNAAGRVNYVNLNNNNLNGTLPASLGNLSQVQTFYLYSNKLSGSIPTSLGNLSQLQNLDLSYNQLTGSIPASLGNLLRLNYLALSSNQLSGSIPASLSNFSQNSPSIFLSNNTLSGCLPAALSKFCGRGFVNISGNPGLPGGGNFSAFCATGAGACVPEPLVLTTPSYVCATGAITFNTTGGDGSPITFQAPGIIRSAPSSSTGVVEQGLRNDPKVLTITAIQSGKTASINFDFGAYCRSLNAVGEPGTRLSVEVLGNPVREQVQVLIRGAEGRSVQLRLTDVTGRVLETRLVEAASPAEEQTFRLPPTQAPGVLLLQAATTQQTQTVKVIKQ
jgi:Leucine-rich repeat (LRR) protein